jgi:hypothetical protein
MTNWEITQMAHLKDHGNEDKPVEEQSKDCKFDLDHLNDQAQDSETHNHKKQMREAEYHKYHDSKD